MRKTCLVLLALLFFPVASAVDGVRPAVEESAAPVYEAVSLDELLKNPGHRLGEGVRFVLQFSGTTPDWNPYLTRFGPGQWLGIEGWSDESFTWEKRVFANPYAQLFVRKGSKAEAVLRKAERFRRYEVHAVTRELFMGRPWIEIESVTLLETTVGEGSILHIGRAFSLLEDGRVGLAIDQLERAKAAPLPAHARVELERRIIECHRLRAKQRGEG